MYLFKINITVFLSYTLKFTNLSFFSKFSILTLCLFLSNITHASTSVRIQFMDVGQADGIVIRTPNNHWVVIDAGTGNKLLGYLSDMGVTKLDMAVVSHRHADHQGGMDDILNSIPADLFVGITDDCPKQKGDDLVREAVNYNSIRTHKFTQSPKSISIDDVKFTVLPLPPMRDCPNHENSNSIVVRMDFGKLSALFTGDSEEDELEWLVQNYPDLLHVDILKAAHHGSNNGFTDEFLDLVDPTHVIISAGVNATYKHPMKEAVDAYIEAANDRVFCTNRQGTIRVYGYQDGRVRVYKQQQNDKSCVYDGSHY